MGLTPEQKQKKIALLKRKKELLLKQAESRGKDKSFLQKTGEFLQSEIPEVAREKPTVIQPGSPVEVAKQFGASTLKSLAVPPIVGFGSKMAIEQPSTTTRAIALTDPKTRGPELAGLATRVGIQQFLPESIKEPVGIGAEIAGGLGFAGLRSLGKNLLATRSKVLNKVTDAVDDIRKIDTELSKNVTNVMAGEAGDIPVNPAVAGEILKEVPEATSKNILKNADLHKIEVLPDGSLKANNRNMWRLRRALDSFLSSKDFIDAEKAVKQAILKARRGLAKMLRDSSDDIKKVMKDFSEFSDKADDVLPILTNRKGKPVANKVIRVFSKKGEPQMQNAVKSLQNQIPKLTKLIERAIRVPAGEAIRAKGGLGALITGAGTIGGIGGVKLAQKFLKNE